MAPRRSGVVALISLCRNVTTGAAQITEWNQCDALGRAERGGLSGSFVTTLNHTRLYSVERFTEYGEVAITVTR